MECSSFSQGFSIALYYSSRESAKIETRTLKMHTELADDERDRTS